MKAYSKHSMVNKKVKGEFITDWHHSEGVFETPQGKFIARVNDKGHFKTLSQHYTRDEAEISYNNFKNKNNAN